MLIIRHHQIITLSFLTQYLDYVRLNHFRSKGYFKILYTQAIDIEPSIPKSKFDIFFCHFQSNSFHFAGFSIISKKLINMADNTDDTRFTRFNYKLVSVGLGTNNIILIDVRDIAKRLNHGRIPGSLHVPRTLMSRLSTNYETFKFLKINNC